MQKDIPSAAGLATVPPESLPELLEQYQQYALRVRQVLFDTVLEQRTYLERLIVAVGATCSSGLLKWLSVSSIQRFVFAYAAERGSGSCKWMQFSLRSFLRFCYLTRYTDRDLSVAVPAARRRHLEHVPRALDSDSIVLLRQSIDGRSPADIRAAAIICLLVTYGVRGVQLRRLCLDHIDWSDRRIRFPAAKGGKHVDHYLTAEAGNRLLDYLRDARPQSTAREVFLTLQTPGKPIRTASQPSSIVRHRLRRAGVDPPGGVSHGCCGLRHAFAGRLVGKVPFKHLADMLGHRDPSTTMIYSKIDFAALEQAALPWPEEDA